MAWSGEWPLPFLGARAIDLRTDTLGDRAPRRASTRDEVRQGNCYDTVRRA
jgi:hypothetical protein